jgi:hypothetical protein
MIAGLGAIIIAVQNASENLLVASGRTHTILVANIIRLCTVVPATFLGYFLYGFYGFLWFNLAATIPLLVYFFWQQNKYGLLDLSIELRRLFVALIVFLLCLAASQLLLKFLPAGWLHLGSKRH